MQFAEYLARLRTVYEAQELELEVGAGASDAAVRAMESALGFPAPDALRSAWQHADGGGSYMPVFLRPGFLTGYDFLPIEDAMAERAHMAERAPRYVGYEMQASDDARVRQGWFQTGWLPFAGFGAGTLLLMVDCSPGEAGTHGQIIAFTHDPDRITWVASDFASLLADSLAEVEADPGEFLEGY